MLKAKINDVIVKHSKLFLVFIILYHAIHKDLMRLQKTNLESFYLSMEIMKMTKFMENLLFQFHQQIFQKNLIILLRKVKDMDQLLDSQMNYLILRKAFLWMAK